MSTFLAHLSNLGMKLLVWFNSRLIQILAWTFNQIQKLRPVVLMIMLALLIGLNKIVDYVLVSVLILAWPLAQLAGVEYSNVQSYLVLAGKAVLLLNTYFPFAEAIAIVGWYYATCVVIWVARHVIKLIPFIG